MLNKKQLQQMLTESTLFKRALSMLSDEEQRNHVEAIARSYLDQCAENVLPTCVKVRNDPEQFKDLQEQVQKRAQEVVTKERTGKKEE
jgi:hypothetical protein